MNSNNFDYVVGIVGLVLVAVIAGFSAQGKLIWAAIWSGTGAGDPKNQNDPLTQASNNLAQGRVAVGNQLGDYFSQLNNFVKSTTQGASDPGGKLGTLQQGLGQIGIKVG